MQLGCSVVWGSRALLSSAARAPEGGVVDVGLVGRSIDAVVVLAKSLQGSLFTRQSSLQCRWAVVLSHTRTGDILQKILKSEILSV